MEKPANKHRWRCCGWWWRLATIIIVVALGFTLSTKSVQAVQYGRPDGDIDSFGWSTAPLYSKLDEVTADGTTTEITTGKNPNQATFQVSLSNVSDPSSSSGHVVRYQINADKIGCSGAAALYQGVTQVALKTISSWPTSYTTDSFTLTSGEADSITDYTDLSFVLQVSGAGGCTATASWVELEVPSAPVPTKVVFTNSQRTITAGVCNGAGNVLTIQTQDASNNPTPPTGTTVIRVTSTSTEYTIYSDSNCTSPVTNGDFTFTTSDTTKNVYIIDKIKSNPTYTMTASKQSGPDTIADGTQSITTQPGAASKLVIRLPNQSFTDRTGSAGTPITGTPTNPTAGSSFSFDIKALDANNNLVDSGTNNYTGSKTISWADSVAGNAPDTTSPSFPGSPVTFTNGAANTLSATYYNAASSRTVEADDTGTPVSGVASTTFTVNFAALQNYEVTVSSPQTAAVCFTGTNTVKARDDWWNYVTDDTSTVDITDSGSDVTYYNSAGCTGGTTTSYTLSSGTVTIYAATNRAQTFAVTATKQASSETGTSSSVTVNATTMTRLVVTLPGETFAAFSGNSGSPSTRTAGTSFDITQITATDDYFNVVTSYTGGKTLAYAGPSNAPDSTAPSYTTSVTFSSGIATTTLTTTLYDAESTTITVTDTGSYGYASSSVTVQPNVVAEMLVVLPNQSYTEAGGVTGSPSNRTAGGAFTIDIKAVDAYRNLNDDGANIYSGSKTMSYSGPSNAPDTTAPSYTSPVSFTAGEATSVSVTLYAAENTTLSATEQGQAYGSASTAFDVDAGAINNYEVTVATPQTAGVCFTGTNTVKARDQWNNYRTSDTSTVDMTDSGSSITYYNDIGCSGGTTTSYTLSGGTATIYVATNLAQSFTITATRQGNSETGTSSTITVNPNTMTRLVVTLPSETFTPGSGNSGGVDTQTAGSQFVITKISATDDYFNLITSYSGAKTLAYSGPGDAPDTTSPSYTTSVSFTSGQSTTTLNTTLYKAETIGITVTDGGQYGYASSNVTIDPGALVDYEVTAATPQTAGVCFTGTNTVKARDDWWNYRTTDTSTVDITDNGSGVTYYNAAACSGGTTTSYTLSGGTVTIYASTNLAQTFAITATRQGNSETGTSSNVTVNPDTMTRLVVTLPSQTFTPGSGNSGSVDTQTAGSQFVITKITATDDYFNVITSYSGAKTLAFSGPGNAPDTTAPSYTTSVSFTAGESTTTLNTTLYKAETVAITVTESASYGYASSNVTVQPAPVAEMLVVLPNQSYTEAGGVTGSPSNRTAGGAFTIDIEAVDSYRNLVDDGVNAYSGSKTMSYSGPSNAPDSTPPSYTSPVSFTAGEATSISTTLYAAETGITLSATEQGQAYGSASTAFDVDVGSVDHYAVAPTATSQEAGVAFNVTITAQDAWDNNLGANYSAPAGTYTFSSNANDAPDTTSPSLGTLVQGDFTNGVATKSVTLYKAESSVSFTATEPTPSSVTGTSTSLVTVSPGDVSADSNDSSITGNAAADTGWAVTITIALKDTWRNPVSGVTAGHITLDATATRVITQPMVDTDANGQTTGSITWSTAGAKTVTAAIATTPLVQNDGTTPDADGLLDDTHAITITLAVIKSSITGGTTIRGGTKL